MQVQVNSSISLALMNLQASAAVGGASSLLGRDLEADAHACKVA
jgi:hypothetical protein